MAERFQSTHPHGVRRCVVSSFCTLLSPFFAIKKAPRKGFLFYCYIWRNQHSISTLITAKAVCLIGACSNWLINALFTLNTGNLLVRSQSIYQIIFYVHNRPSSIRIPDMPSLLTSQYTLILLLSISSYSRCAFFLLPYTQLRSTDYALFHIYDGLLHVLLFVPQLLRWRYCSCFNPRTRVGCDADRLMPTPSLFISIHAPAWGATTTI